MCVPPFASPFHDQSLRMRANLLSRSRSGRSSFPASSPTKFNARRWPSAARSLLRQTRCSLRLLPSSPSLMLLLLPRRRRRRLVPASLMPHAVPTCTLTQSHARGMLADCQLREEMDGDNSLTTRRRNERERERERRRTKGEQRREG